VVPADAIFARVNGLRSQKGAEKRERNRTPEDLGLMLRDGKTVLKAGSVEDGAETYQHGAHAGGHGGVGNGAVRASTGESAL
jgi:hypothetical protein